MSRPLRPFLVAILLPFLSLSLPPATHAAPASSQRPELAQGMDNKPERLEWFRDLGFGLFIHWGLDSQIGSVISHSLAGASDEYRRKYFAELPQTFAPRKFNPEDWARLAKLAGVKYVVFTTKHHSGFAMWDTKTTPFNVMKTPAKRDLTADIVKAFRAQGIAIGFYFSPEDFHWLQENGKTVTRRPHPGVTPQENPALMKLDRAQLQELATRYGAIDVWFLDGEGAGMRDVIWKAQPKAVITRDVIDTPEQTIPGVPMNRAWESCLTMGTQWQYKPTHESYKSGTELIQILIETRAKGGNLLLNVGPKPDGELAIEQEERLREIALWNFAMGESIENVRPWVVTNEGNLWFTKKKDENTLYVHITRTPWVMGERKKFSLRSVRSTAKTEISVLGSDGKIIEYKPEADAASHFRQEENTLQLDVVMAQRLYNDRKWPNPLVVKLTNVEPAMRPPTVLTVAGKRTGAAAATLSGKLESLGQADSVEVGFEYRKGKRTEELLNAEAPWTATPLAKQTAPGAFSATVTGLNASEFYEFRAVVKHPLVRIAGEEKPLGQNVD
jgi:alpha-L-fucosidase